MEKKRVSFQSEDGKKVTESLPKKLKKESDSFISFIESKTCKELWWFWSRNCDIDSFFDKKRDSYDDVIESKFKKILLVGDEAKAKFCSDSSMVFKDCEQRGVITFTREHFFQIISEMKPKSQQDYLSKTLVILSPLDYLNRRYGKFLCKGLSFLSDVMNYSYKVVLLMGNVWNYNLQNISQLFFASEQPNLPTTTRAPGEKYGEHAGKYLFDFFKNFPSKDEIETTLGKMFGKMCGQITPQMIENAKNQFYNSIVEPNTKSGESKKTKMKAKFIEDKRLILYNDLQPFQFATASQRYSGSGFHFENSVSMFPLSGAQIESLENLMKTSKLLEKSKRFPDICSGYYDQKWQSNEKIKYVLDSISDAKGNILVISKLEPVGESIESYIKSSYKGVKEYFHLKQDSDTSKFSKSDSQVYFISDMTEFYQYKLPQIHHIIFFEEPEADIEMKLLAWIYQNTNLSSNTTEIKVVKLRYCIDELKSMDILRNMENSIYFIQTSLVYACMFRYAKCV